ncbi:hypothetical protein AAZX31_04G227600 [Glycine max]
MEQSSKKISGNTGLHCLELQINDIGSLKDICEESLLEDLSTRNVLEKLNEAWLYQLHKLKKGCLVFLFQFGKIHDIKDEINNFFLHADTPYLRIAKSLRAMGYEVLCR